MITWQHRLAKLAEAEAQIEQTLELCRAQIVETILDASEHGASQVSIAEVLGCSQSAVSQRVSRQQRRRGLRSA